MNLWPAVVWNLAIWFGTAWLVFERGHSGWWFVLTLAITDYYTLKTEKRGVDRQ